MATSQFRDEQSFKTRLDGTMSNLIQWKASLPMAEGGTGRSLSSQFYVKFKKNPKTSTQKSYESHTAHSGIFTILPATVKKRKCKSTDFQKL